MASNSPSPPDDHHHATTAHGVSIPADFATPTPEGRARYEQSIRNMVQSSEQTDARVAQRRELERFFGPTDPVAVEDEEDGDNSMSADAPPGPRDDRSLTAFLASDRGRAALAQMTPLAPEDANRMPGGSMSALRGQDFGPGPLQPGPLFWQARRPIDPRANLDAAEQMDKQAIAAFLESDRGKAASKQMMELYAEDAVIENNMRAAVIGNMHRHRPVLAPGARVSFVAHPIDPSGGEQSSQYAMADGAPSPPRNRLPAQQHAGDVRAEKMAHIEQCIKIVGDSTINAFDHVRLGNMITNLETRSLHAMRPADVSRLRAISASFAGLAIAFATPPKRRGRKQRRTYRRGKPDVRMAPTEVDPAHASDRSRMDAQPRPKKGAWPTFYCKSCPAELPYGTLSRDVLCDACAAHPLVTLTTELQLSPPSRNALIQSCLPIVYGRDWECTSNAVIAEFNAQAVEADEYNARVTAIVSSVLREQPAAAAAAAAPHPTSVDGRQQRMPVRFINGEWMTIDPARAMDVHPVIHERETVGAVAKFRTQTATAAAAASHPTPERMTLDAGCVAATQAGERAAAAASSSSNWDTNPILRDRETVGASHAREGQESQRLEALTRFCEEHKASTGPSEFSRRMQALYNEHTQQQQQQHDDWMLVDGAQEANKDEESLERV